MIPKIILGIPFILLLEPPGWVVTDGMGCIMAMGPGWPL